MRITNVATRPSRTSNNNQKKLHSNLHSMPPVPRQTAPKCTEKSRQSTPEKFTRNSSREAVPHLLKHLTACLPHNSKTTHVSLLYPSPSTSTSTSPHPAARPFSPPLPLTRYTPQSPPPKLIEVVISTTPSQHPESTFPRDTSHHITPPSSRSESSSLRSGVLHKSTITPAPYLPLSPPYWASRPEDSVTGIGRARLGPGLGGEGGRRSFL